MKKAILIITGMLFTMLAYSQTTIKGQVFEVNKQPLEYATIALYQIKDSTLQQGGVTDAKGNFVLEKVSKGNYFITVTMIGYEKVSREIVIANQQTHTLPDITLYESSQSLKEVVISATRNFVEQQADKMVINPEASITSASEDALEILRKSPGIVVDKDDNITLKNKQVKVLIDGRPSYMTGEQLAAMLRNMQATSIDRIEIIENPSSQYDAEGDGGIVNIRTKRGMMRGYNGSMTLGAGVGKRFSDNYGLDLNYRNEKWNIYGNYYGGQRRGWNSVDISRYFMNSDGSLYKQYSESNWNSNYNGIKLGVDYYITPKQVVGVMARTNFNKNNNDGDGESRITDSDGEMIQQMYVDNTGSNKFNNLLLNMNYKWNIDTLGRELTIDADAARYHSKNINDMNTNYIPPITPLITHKDQRGTSDFYSIKVDYVWPLSTQMKMEMGVKSSWAKIDSDMEFNELDIDGNWNDPNKMSNHFIYQENINAAYLSGQYKLTEKTSIQAGVRGEQTVSNGDNRTSDEQNKRDYFNLFPTFFAQHKLNDNHQVGVSYSYRIGRPPYWVLNPFMWMLDPYTYNKGNPLLNPQFTHAAKLSYTIQNKYILSVDYSYTKDAWTQIFEQDDESRTAMIVWKNLNNHYNTSATLVLPIKITKWLNTNTNITGFYSQYESILNEQEVNRSQFTFSGNTSLSFTLPKDFAFELSGRYRSKNAYGMLMMNGRGSVDLGIQKQLFDKKASIKLSASDIFAIQKNSYSGEYDNVNLHGLEKYDSRRINLTLTWRFGRNDIKAARQRSTGLDEESGRAGN